MYFAFPFLRYAPNEYYCLKLNSPELSKWSNPDNESMTQDFNVLNDKIETSPKFMLKQDHKIKNKVI